MGFGVLEPRIHHLSFSGLKMAFQAPKTLRFKGKMANLEAKKYCKTGEKNAKRTNGTQFTRAHPPPPPKQSPENLFIFAFLSHGSGSCPLLSEPFVNLHRNTFRGEVTLGNEN